MSTRHVDSWRSRDTATAADRWERQACKHRCFFLSETEISQQQFFTVMELAKNLPEIRTKLEDFTSGDQLKKFIADDSFPMFLIGPHEAAAFCILLDQLYDLTNPEGLVTYRFRLPTNHEWQYAARANRSLQKFRDYNRWPELDRETMGKIEAFWEKLGQKEKFLGTQDQVFRMLVQAKERWKPGDPKSVEDWETALGILSANFLGFEGEMGLGMSLKLRPVADTNANADQWFIKHVHGNVAEWTLNARNDWESLINGTLAPNTKVIAAGGNFRSGESWKQLTIWGGRVAEYKNVSTKADKDEIATYQAGIRVVMEAAPSPRYLAAIRGVLDEAAKNPAKAMAKLEKMKASLSLLDEKTSRPIRQQLSYYKGLVHLVEEKRDPAMEEIRQTALQTPPNEDTSFLNTLEYLVKKENTK